MRHDDALENARLGRLARLASSGRSSGIRIRIAAAAQGLSDALEALAQNLASGEAR
jgi:hypothetical protein